MDYDVIIIGAGPAGLTAALYASRAGLKTLIIESLKVPGQAVLTDCIENYPGFPEGISGFELIERFRKQVDKFGTKITTGDVKRIEQCKEGLKGWKIDTGGKVYSTLSLIIATGARPKKLGLPKEEEFRGRGISYCAVCDAAFFKDRDVVVVGGGDSAVEEALFLAKFAKRVTMIHRRERLRAAKVLKDRAFSNKKMEFMWDVVLSEILGKDKVSGIKVKNVKSGREEELSCDGIFIFVGYEPNTDFVKGLVKLDKEGYIVTDSNMEAEKAGIFACGDCCQKVLRQVVTACGDGATAAFQTQQYVEELKGIAYK